MSKKELKRRGDLLNEIADAMGYDRAIWQIATCNALAHNIKGLTENSQRFFEENVKLHNEIDVLKRDLDAFEKIVLKVVATDIKNNGELRQIIKDYS